MYLNLFPMLIMTATGYWLHNEMYSIVFFSEKFTIFIMSKRMFFIVLSLPIKALWIARNMNILMDGIHNIISKPKHNQIK